MLVERYKFAVDDGVTGKFPKRAQHRWKSAGEILVVARPELGAAAGLATHRTKAVELQFVVPLAAFRQTFDALAKHRLEGKTLAAGISKIQPILELTGRDQLCCTRIEADCRSLRGRLLTCNWPNLCPPRSAAVAVCTQPSSSTYAVFS